MTEARPPEAVVADVAERLVGYVVRYERHATAGLSSPTCTYS